MVSNLTPLNEQFLNGLDLISRRMEHAQRQISTGVRFEKVSDNPDQVSVLLQARASLDGSQQVLTNLGRVKNEVDAGEQALQSAVQLFDQAQTLGAAGATGTETAAARADLAQQLDSMLQQMVGLSGTSVEGRYIFSGDADQQAPYDSTLVYFGSASTRLIQHPNGTTFAVAKTAQEIFEPVFTAIAALSTAMRNNDEAAIRNLMDGMPAVSQALNSELAFYGTAQTRVAAATEFAHTQQLQLQTQISALEDTDVSSAVLELTQAQTQQQAALQSKAQMPRTTLFNFLA
jgi:flagellar hook-associated protein 3 FlgL